MQLINGDLVYSATDLVGFLACKHLTNLDLAAVARLVQRPVRADAELDRIALRGQQHEERFLAELKGRGLSVTTIEPDASILIQANNFGMQPRPPSRPCVTETKLSTRQPSLTADAVATRTSC